jgi:hypothetical protein
MLSGYELRGVIETPGTFNFAAVMFEGDSIFVPLYNGLLSAILFPSVRANSPAMLFNRQMVDAMSLLPREMIPKIEEEET